MLKLGMMGLSEGNGHPYSFSAIINGYDDEGMRDSGWKGIHAYLRERDASDFGISDARVTHIWTQDAAESRKISRAVRVEHVVADPREMIGAVDGVVLARDDHEHHLEMARPFLDAGIPVFIDKPLSLDPSVLKVFKPFLEAGKIYSCSGIRYARELDKLRASIAEFGPVKLVRGTVLRSWEKYAIHMLDGIFGVIPFAVERVFAHPADHGSVTLYSSAGGPLIQIDALGQAPLTMQFDVWSETSRFHADALDHFFCFQRSLWHFIEQIRTGKPQIDPGLTLNLMKVLIAGRRSRELGRPVALAEVSD